MVVQVGAKLNEHTEIIHPHQQFVGRNRAVMNRRVRATKNMVPPQDSSGVQCVTTRSRQTGFRDSTHAINNARNREYSKTRSLRSVSTSLSRSSHDLLAFQGADGLNYFGKA
jgi:hypothetical protein